MLNLNVLFATSAKTVKQNVVDYITTTKGIFFILNRNDKGKILSYFAVDHIVCEDSLRKLLEAIIWAQIAEYKVITVASDFGTTELETKDGITIQCDKSKIKKIKSILNTCVAYHRDLSGNLHVYEFSNTIGETSVVVDEESANAFLNAKNSAKKRGVIKTLAMRAAYQVQFNAMVSQEFNALSLNEAKEIEELKQKAKEIEAKQAKQAKEAKEAKQAKEAKEAKQAKEAKEAI